MGRAFDSSSLGRVFDSALGQVFSKSEDKVGVLELAEETPKSSNFTLNIYMT